MKTLVLVGSGEFTPSMVKIDEYLISSIKTNPSKINVAIIPTATGEEADYDKWIKRGVTHFTKLGVQPIGLSIAKKAEADKEEYINTIQKSSIIYFSGGRPDYLFTQLQGTKLWQIIIQKYQTGTVLVGSSAGAMVMGNYYLANTKASTFKNLTPIFKPGFSLISYPIIPHYDWIKKKDPGLVNKILAASPNKNYIGIDENTALIIQGHDILVNGSGSIWIKTANDEKQYLATQKVPLLI